MKILNNIKVSIIVLILCILLFLFSLFDYVNSKFESVSNDNTIKEVVIEPGTSINEIASILYKEKLIKSELVFKLYIKATEKSNLKASTYELSEDMDLVEIIEILEKGNGKNPNEITITFKEGINMRTVARVIAENTDNTEEDLYNKLKDKEYIKNLINKYWFLDDVILNDNIYYSLEGYLYPNTYSFSSKNISIETILEVLLDEMEKKLTPYKDAIAGRNMSVHQIITLASITELEGSTSEERKYITSVFINRINSGMTLGSDVTTYYGAKINMGDRDLTRAEVNECNNYNTRCATFKGLPISPIANPSADSIISVIEPITSDYYYFVADKNKKIYFSKSLTEHNNTIYKLKQNNLWYEY